VVASLYFSWVYKASASNTAFFNARLSGKSVAVDGSAGSCWGNTACAWIGVVENAINRIRQTKRSLEVLKLECAGIVAFFSPLVG